MFGRLAKPEGKRLNDSDRARYDQGGEACWQRFQKANRRRKAPIDNENVGMRIAA
jgi:hypothetical protein